MQDRQLIETLFRQHYERMFLTARTLLCDPEEARDVVSDGGWRVTCWSVYATNV